MKNKAVVAVARGLSGFVWAIGREVQASGWKGIDEAVTRFVQYLRLAETAETADTADTASERKKGKEAHTSEMDSDAGRGTRRSCGHWGTLDNVVEQRRVATHGR
jgi:hypothetical protein